MFTGLIETMGTVMSRASRGPGALLGVRPDEIEFSVAAGGSVAIDGVCLTMEKKAGDVLYFTAVNETLFRTTLGRFQPGVRVNLERALPADGRLDGHFVLGHVDGIGMIAEVKELGEGAGSYCSITVPDNLAVFMAEKGSVAIDGVSLTIAKVIESTISVALIPRTLAATAISLKKAGDRVNLECDVIARYIYRILTGSVAAGSPLSRRGDRLVDLMERSGF
jgi:riboflavin synthase